MEMDKAFNTRLLKMLGVRCSALPKQLIEDYKERYFNDTDREIVELVESRGIAITAYNELISDIVNYLNKVMYIGGTVQYINKPYLGTDGNKMLLPVAFYSIRIPDSIMDKWG